MQKSFYSLKEKLLLLSLFLTSVASLIFFLNYKHLAFPEYNIKFDINHQEAKQKSLEFAKSQNLPTEDYQQATIFDMDYTTKTYLERELGPSQTFTLANTQLDIWHFNTRFFKPLEKKEYTISFLPSGKLVGFNVLYEEGEKGTSLTKDDAQRQAENFIAKHTTNDLTEWKLVSSEEIKRPARVDHSFIWEKNNFKARDATLRLDVIVSGNLVSGYSEFLKIPESWQRLYEKETSRNQFAQTVAESINFLLFNLSIIIVFILKFRSSELKWRFPIIVGVISFVVSILVSLNSIPLAIYSYPTTISWEAFIGGLIFFSLVGSLIAGLHIFLVLASGEAIYREVFKKKLSISSFTWGLQTKPVNLALILGTFVGVIMFAYMVIYYILGSKIGYWIPADINYSDAFNSLIPWVYPLFLGFAAATMEEGVFRLFGISFLRKYLKSTPLAIVITSVVWAFLHSNYPQTPWFARGIELSIVGVVFGTLFVRFGIVAPLVAHYTFNALLTAISLYASGNLYVQLSSTLVAVFPLIVAVFFLFRAIFKKGFLVIKEEVNLSLKKGIEKVKQKSRQLISDNLEPHLPLSNIKMVSLIILGLIGVFVSWTLYPQISLDKQPLKIDRSLAQEIALSELNSKNINLVGFQSATLFNSQNVDSQAAEYILEKGNFGKLKEVYPQQIPSQYWLIRFFKPLEKQEYRVNLLPSGKIYYINYVFDENSKGANLTEQEAIKVAGDYLVSEHTFDLSKYKIVEKKSKKRVNRTDHYFTFESSEKLVDQAVLRTDINILGDTPSGFSNYIKIPESWIREKEKTGLKDFIVLGITTIAVGVLVVLTLITFLNLVKERMINGKRLLKIAAIVATCFIVTQLNTLPIFFAGYRTSIPIETYLVQEILGTLVGFVLFITLSMAVVGTFISLWSKFIGPLFVNDQKGLRSYLQDALVSSYTAPPIAIGVLTLITYILIKTGLGNSQSSTYFEQLSGLQNIIPALSTIAPIPLKLIGISCFGILILVCFKYLKKWLKVVLFGLLIIMIAGLSVDSIQKYLVYLLEVFVLVGLLLGFVLFVARKNLLSYIGTIVVASLFFPGLSLIQQENSYLKYNGLVLILLSLSPLGIYLWLWRISSIKRSKPLDI